MPRLFWIAFVLIQGSWRSSCLVVLNLTQTNAYAMIECSSNSDVLFKFIRNEINTAVTLAECETTLNTCYLVDKSHDVNYATSSNGHGGRLHVLNVCEETYGTYICFETYNPDSYARTELKPHVADKDNSVPENTSKQCKEYSICLAVLGMNVVVLFFAMVQIILTYRLVPGLRLRKLICLSKSKSVDGKFHMTDALKLPQANCFTEDIVDSSSPLMFPTAQNYFDGMVPLYRAPKVCKPCWDPCCACTSNLFPTERRHPYLYGEGMGVSLRHSFVGETYIE